VSDSRATDGGTRAPEEQERKSLFARIVLFVRQVISELKKVVTPSRHELFTYIIVVIVFVAIVMAFVGLLDYVIGLGVFALLG
jgi:preprotein translocase subunit SecE